MASWLMGKAGPPAIPAAYQKEAYHHLLNVTPVVPETSTMWLVTPWVTEKRLDIFSNV